jgi:hypothetical protein
VSPFYFPLDLGIFILLSKSRSCSLIHSTQVCVFYTEDCYCRWIYLIVFHLSEFGRAPFFSLTLRSQQLSSRFPFLVDSFWPFWRRARPPSREFARAGFNPRGQVRHRARDLLTIFSHADSVLFSTGVLLRRSFSRPSFLWTAFIASSRAALKFWWCSAQSRSRSDSFPSVKILVVLGICHQSIPVSSWPPPIFCCDFVVPKFVRMLVGGSRYCS